MKSNDKLKEIDIKNCTSYYFNDLVKTKDFDLIILVFVWNVINFSL